MRQEVLFRDKNFLFNGDNLDILRYRIASDSVDLVYLDPPFNSNKDYSIIFKEQDEEGGSEAQIKAFGDTWKWGPAARDAYRDAIENGSDALVNVMEAFRTFLGPNHMLAYLSMMAPRLVELHRVLKPTGSIFLHCDPTASHYLKLLMDAIFGPTNFRNEIVWCYTGPGSPRIKQFLRKHDVVFWYSMSKTWTFNADDVRIPHSEKTKANYKSGLKGSGFVGAEHVIHRSGKVPEDWWRMAIAPRGKEYLHYPTQKPRALLERIIKAASNEQETVLDPFCGCGTSIDAAERLGRRWVGIDITQVAIDVVRGRMREQFGAHIDESYTLIRDPVSLPDALALAKQDDKYEFQWWVLDRLGATETIRKRGKDKGVDGRINFYDDETGPSKRIVISVKAGKTGPADVRDLRGVMARDDATIGVFVTIKKPTRDMELEAIAADVYHSDEWGRDYDRLQILTAKDIIEGKRIDYPSGEIHSVSGFRRRREPVDRARAVDKAGHRGTSKATSREKSTPRVNPKSK